MKVITTLFVGAFRAFYKDKRVIIAQRNAPLTLWQVPWSVAFSWMKVILTVLEGKQAAVGKVLTTLNLWFGFCLQVSS